MSDWCQAPIATPLGPLVLVEDADGRLRAADWADAPDRLAHWLARRYRGRRPHRVDAAALSSAAPLADYFAGNLARVADIPLALDGTPLQRAVWELLTTLTPGTTLTYGALAAQLGRPRAARAVGAANAANPCAVVVPCHRLVGADGSLTGYAGGLARKRWLLAHEQARRPA
ncbi:MAG: methylated-DNA--[protein]-cysteine S-methyltransferase [Gammaproteobacteria bacterium]